tara:strand:- start:1561 stop:2868 length:1308 start_codon:yes stop_codon:yes gene_type:complete
MSKNIEKKILSLVDEFVASNNIEKFIPGKTYISCSGKVIDSDEIKNIVLSALDGWLTTGRFNELFEKTLASRIPIKNLITVNSGSSANLCAFSSLTSEKLKDKAVKCGDEVITVAAGFPTTVNPIIQNNAIPVFVDVKLGNYNILIENIEQAITSKTKAIVLAHTLGNPFEANEIKDICKKKGLWLMEDCCDALGSKYEDNHVGTFGDVSTLSFYPAHHITMGEGGAVFTNNIRLKMIIESFRDWGRDCYCKTGCDNTCKKRYNWQLGDLPLGYDHKFIYSHAGYNLKITDMQAACGVAQLKKLDNFIKIRKENFKYLLNKFKKFEEFFILPEPTKKSSPSWFGFPLTIRPETKIERSNLLKFLEEKKIGTRLLFGGNLTKQPYMINKKFLISGSLKNTEIIMNNSFWLGVYPGLNYEHLDYIENCISLYLKSLR